MELEQTKTKTVTHTNRQTRPVAKRPVTPDTPAIDTDVLDVLASVIGRTKVNQFIADFLGHARMHRRNMRDALATDDTEVLYRSAHMLVAVSGNLGALEVSRLCDGLQRAVAAHDMAAAHEMFADVDNAIDRALASLSAMIDDKTD